MIAFVLRRLIQAVIVMVAVAFFAFLLFPYVGDPVVFLLGQDAKPEQIQAHRALVQQMYKLYGARHFDRYEFLLALTDKLGGIGLEHQRSSENSGDTGYFTEWDKTWLGRDLLPHEFNHSWNGKYRRGADLTTPNFNVPMGDSLLWLYEGQTQFWGQVLAARSGLWSPQQARDVLANVAGTYDRGRPGLAWRNLQDTTNDPTIAQRRALAFRNYQMSEDYYSGGQMVWLDVDGVSRRHAVIRIDAADRAVIEDLGSTNGTFVGGVPVARATLLRDGDCIRIGTVELTFRAWVDTPTKRIARRT